MSPAVSLGNMAIGDGPDPRMIAKGHFPDQSWMSEFDTFQVSAATQSGQPFQTVPESTRMGHVVKSAGPVRKRSTNPVRADRDRAMDNLRAEMKLLNWHKLANEAALRAALLKTKKMKAEGGRGVRPAPAPTTLAMPLAEKTSWMRQIIEEEQSKPLQVTKDFKTNYEAKEQRNEGRLENEVAAHMRCLRNLRRQVRKTEVWKRDGLPLINTADKYVQLSENFPCSSRAVMMFLQCVG